MNDHYPYKATRLKYGPDIGKDRFIKQFAVCDDNIQLPESIYLYRYPKIICLRNTVAPVLCEGSHQACMQFVELALPFLRYLLDVTCVHMR